VSQHPTTSTSSTSTTMRERPEPPPAATTIPATPTTRATARLVMADRGDPLVEPLAVALADRYDVVGRVGTELTRPERLLVAATTVRPGRHVWSERFHKSGLGVALRSRRARAGLAGLAAPADLVLQTHALFETDDARTVMYVDCTHRQSMAHWPAWNPLRGRALARWLAREGEQYRRAAHVFAFYDQTARSLVEEYDVPADRVSVVGAGANFTSLPPLRPRPSGPPTVLFVGNDFERKGGLHLVEAFARLRRRVPDVRLRIVGTPHPLPPQDGVEVLGRIRDRDRMSQLYAEADVFCLPSLFDPFPGALLEAMAHGLPAVVTTTSGIPEIVEAGTTALTVGRGPTIATELTDALERLLVDPALARRMGRAGRRRVEDRFAWSHVVDRMAPALDRLAGVGPTTAITATTATTTPTTGEEPT